AGASRLAVGSSVGLSQSAFDPSYVVLDCAALDAQLSEERLSNTVSSTRPKRGRDNGRLLTDVLRGLLAVAVAGDCAANDLHGLLAWSEKVIALLAAEDWSQHL